MSGKWEKTTLSARARDQSDTSSSLPLNKRANEGKNTKTGDFPWDHAEKKKLFFPLPGEKGILLGKGACVENNPVWLWVIVFAAGVNSRSAVGHTQKYRPISEEGKVFFPGKKDMKGETRASVSRICGVIFYTLFPTFFSLFPACVRIWFLFGPPFFACSCMTDVGLQMQKRTFEFFCCGKQLAILFSREKKGGGSGARGLLSVKLLSPSPTSNRGEKRGTASLVVHFWLTSPLSPSPNLPLQQLSIKKETNKKS